MDLRCYFCNQAIVPGEHHTAEDCRSVLLERIELLQEQVQELEEASRAHGTLPGAAPASSTTALPSQPAR